MLRGWLGAQAFPKRIGYARDGRSMLLTNAIPVPKPGEIPTHEKFYYLELLKRAGWIDSIPEESFIKLHVPESNRARAARFLADAGARRPRASRIAIGAGAAYGSAKCWPPARFAELANRLRSQWDADVIFFGAASETPVSSAIASEMRQASHRPHRQDRHRGTSRRYFRSAKFLSATIPAQCTLPQRSACPAVGIFGPTDPFGTAPVTPRSIVVRQQPYCSPCFLRRCPIDHRCMTHITPGEVEAAVDPWLSAATVDRV